MPISFSLKELKGWNYMIYLVMTHHPFTQYGKSANNSKKENDDDQHDFEVEFRDQGSNRLLQPGLLFGFSFHFIYPI
jgi:hypothetical protein